MASEEQEKGTNGDGKQVGNFRSAWIGSSRKFWLIGGATLLVLGLLGISQITFFIIQPLGVVPEGRTIVMLRLQDGRLVDSADAICERKMGGVSLMCRLVTLGAVVEKAHILLRLPYSETLYLWSAEGAVYDR